MVRAGAHLGMKQARLHFAVLATLLGACDLEPKDGGDIIEDSTGGDEDASGGQTGDNGDEADDGSNPDAGGQESGGEGQTDVELCEDSCVWETTCDPGYETNQCVEDCLFNLGAYDGDEVCDGAMHQIRACMADFLSCSPEPASLPVECQEAFETDVLCEDQYSCSVAGGGGEGTCFATELCGMDSERTIECDADTCTCMVDGEVTGSCADGFDSCHSYGGSSTEPDFPAECCGFEDWGQPQLPGG